MTRELPGVERREQATEAETQEDRSKTLRKGWRAWERKELGRLDAAEKDATTIASKVVRVMLAAALAINREQDEEVDRLRQVWRDAETATQDALARERMAKREWEVAKQVGIGRGAEWLLADEYNAATTRFRSDREERARIRATAAAGLAEGKFPPVEDAS